jgi:hypothetical protein
MGNSGGGWAMQYSFSMILQGDSPPHRLLLLSTAILGALAAGSPAWGCSTAIGAPPPTNYEVVREAEVIVLAKSVAAEPSADDKRHPWGYAIRFEVEEVLKGDFRPSTLTLDGTLEFGGRGSEDDFSRARPGAYAGGCLAFDYRLNQHYVLFLAWSELNERWSVTGPVFSRVNEEVDVPDSPWLKAVRHYLRVAALHDYDQEKTALRELRAQAAAGASPKMIPKALVGDIDRHFKTPSIAKSPADLMDLYEHAESDSARRDVLWGLVMTAPPAAKTLLRGQLLKETRADWLGPLGQYFSTVPDHEILGPLSQSWDRLPSDSWSRQTLLRALAKAAGPSDAPIMTELLRKTADGDQASILARWIVAQGSDTRVAIGILQSRLTDTPGDFTRYQDALAILGDPAVVAWAEKRMWSDSKLTDWQTANVLALSPLPEADAAARKIIESGDTKRIESLVTAYVYTNGSPRRWDRLDDILRSQSTNAPLLAELKTQFFYLRRDGTDEDKATANRLFERTREALAALPSRQP